MNLSERAAALDITDRECVKLADVDPRIVSDEMLSTKHATDKTRAWLAAGRPDADVSKVLYRGSDRVYRALVQTLQTLPAPVRWHATTRVLWVSIGGDRVAGWMSVVPVGAPHVIAIDASMPEDLLPAIVAHELAHAVHMDEEAAPPTERIEAHERTAITLAVETLRGGDIETAIRKLYEPERLANALAARFGYPSSIVCPDRIRLDYLRADLLAARERAAEIVADLSLPLAACERTNS